MFLEFITLLMLFTFVVSQLLLTRYISKNLRKDRELSRVRDERALQVFKRVQVIAEQAVQTQQLVIDHQTVLDEKLDEVTKTIYEYNTFVNLQLQKLRDLVYSDINIARQNELTRTRELKVALERLGAATTMSRQPVPTTDMLALESATNRIKELETILEDNKKVE